MATTKRYGSLDLLTGKDGQVPQLLLNGVNTIASLNNVITVNTINDLPEAVGDVITTPDNSTVVWGPGVQMGTTRIIPGVSNSFIGLNVFQAPVSYTGTDPFISVEAGKVFATSRMQYNTPNATVFDLDSAAPGAPNGILVDNIQVISCDKFITTDDAFFVVDTVGIFSCVDGIVCSGTSINVGSINKINFFNFTGTAIDFGSVVFNEYEQRDIIFTGSGTAMSGLVNSGNLAANVEGEISSCNFTGATTPLNNIATTDIRWEFQGNSGVPNSTKDIFTYMTATETVTITTQGVFVPIAGGNWLSKRANRFSASIDGVVEYLGETDVDVSLDGGSHVEKVGGGSDEVEMRINLDTGAGFPAMLPAAMDGNPDTTENSAATSVNPKDLIKISTGDKLRLEVANNSGTANIICGENTKLRSLNGL